MAENNSVEKKVSDMKTKLLKKQHTHAGNTFKVGTPLDSLKASDSDIEFMVKHGVI